MTGAAASSRSARIRQILLAAVMGAMMLYFGGEWVLKNAVQGPVEAAQRKNADLKQKIAAREVSLEKARRAAATLERWRSQSLPADTELARSLYQAWLIELVEDVGFTAPSVNSSEPVPRGGIYHALGFSLRAQGTIEQLTRFLHAYYETDLMHQIRTLSITPLSQGRQLDLSIAVEALALADRKRSAQDPEQVFTAFRQQTMAHSDRLVSADLDDYRAISDRNLFAFGAEGDATDLTHLTSISAVDGEAQAWFMTQDTGQLSKLQCGETLQVGPLTFTLVEILGSDVVLEADGERWLLGLGERLTDAFALPPEY